MFATLKASPNTEKVKFYLLLKSYEEHPYPSVFLPIEPRLCYSSTYK